MLEKRERSGVIAGILLPMGLVCLFAFCSLALALFGGRAYKQVQAKADEGTGTTVAANYLRTKLSQAGGPDAVALRSEDGLPVLVITSGGEAPYETRIYMDGGLLREAYVAAGQAFDPAAGMQIAALARCDFSLDEDGLFTAEIESLTGAVTRARYALTTGGAL